MTNQFRLAAAVDEGQAGAATQGGARRAATLAALLERTSGRLASREREPNFHHPVPRDDSTLLWPVTVGWIARQFGMGSVSNVSTLRYPWRHGRRRKQVFI